MRVFDYKAGAPQFRDRQLSGKEKTDWIGGKSQILCRDLHLRSLESGIFGIEGRRGEKGNAARLRLHVENGTVRRVTVDMGRPEVGDLLTGDAAVSTSFGRYEGRIVSMGNPHFVIFTPAVALVDLAAEGPLLERHERFPGRTNVEFAQVDGDVIRMRVWERGSGPTLACGTGACATAVAAIAAGLCDRQVTVRMDGGPLTIEWRADDGHVYMTGEARTVYEGTIHII